MKKTTKTTKTTATFNFKPLFRKMRLAHDAPLSLRDGLIEMWNATPQAQRDVQVFRAEFIPCAIEQGYDRRWAMDVCAKAGFRTRAAGGGRKPTKPAKGTAEAVLAQAKALTPKELKRFVKMFAAI